MTAARWNALVGTAKAPLAGWIAVAVLCCASAGLLVNEGPDRLGNRPPPAAAPPENIVLAVAAATVAVDGAVGHVKAPAAELGAAAALLLPNNVGTVVLPKTGAALPAAAAASDERFLEEGADVFIQDGSSVVCR